MNKESLVSTFCRKYREEITFIWNLAWNLALWLILCFVHADITIIVAWQKLWQSLVLILFFWDRKC